MLRVHRAVHRAAGSSAARLTQSPPVLAHARPGEELTILSVPEELAATLAREGLVPGGRVTVESVVPLGGPVVTLCGAARVALGRRVARGIVVEVVA